MLSRLIYPTLVALSFVLCVSIAYADSDSLADRIENLDAIESTIIDHTTPGRFKKSRHHVMEEDTELVESYIDELNDELCSLRQELIHLLTDFRESEFIGDVVSETLVRDHREIRRLITKFNQKAKKLRKRRVVFREHNRLGRWGGSESIVYKCSSPIGLTRFDLTHGFTVECRESMYSGILAYRNPQTGRISWHDSWYSSVAVTGVKRGGGPVVEENWLSGYSSALNEETGRWAVHKGKWAQGSASAYNPATGRVEHRDGGWNNGIAAAYNPSTKRLEWKEGGWYNGIAGYYDPRKRKVVWKESWYSGVACIWRIEGKYYTSYGFPGEPDDDDSDDDDD